MKKPTLLFAFPISFAVACGGDDDTGVGPDAGGTVDPDADQTVDSDADEQGGCTVAEWDAPDFEDNAAEFLAIRNQLATLKTQMEDDEVAEDSDRDVLINLYEAGDTSLADIVTPAYDEILQKTFNDFTVLVTHPGAALLDDQGNWTGGGGDREGAVVAGRGLDGAGNEPVQLLEKGLFAAAQYNYALTLTEGDITPATIDALAAAFGAGATLESAEVDDSAGYAYSMGLYADVAQALTDAKAYAADDECTTERDEAVVSFFRQWELANMARAVYYTNDGIAGIQAADGDEEALADALHGLSEGIGLAIGFYGIGDPSSGPLSGAGRVITDAQVEDIMAAYGIDNGTEGTLNDSTTAEIFVNDETTARDAQDEFEAVLIEAYDLAESDIEGFYVDVNPE